MSNEFGLSLLDDDDTPLMIQEDIIKYLINQNVVDAEDEGFMKKVTDFTERDVHDVLEELLHRFDLTHTLKKNYEARAKAHNQRQLFDLKKIIPDFNIDDEMYDLLTFRENLIIYTFNPENEAEEEPVGGLCLDIQKASGCPPVQRRSLNVEERIQQILRQNSSNFPVESGDAEANKEEVDLEDDLETQKARACSKFLVHLSSEFDVRGFSAGSRITTWLDRDVHTLEELRKEFVRCTRILRDSPYNFCLVSRFLTQESETEHLLQKTLYCGLLKGCYYVKHTSTSEESLDDRKFYSLLKARNFISEGSNFLLYRYLAVTKYVGSFELSAMYINGDMCRNVYECFEPETMEINGREMQVCKIHRNVIEECGLEHNCVTILSLQGQILKQNWEGTNYCLRVNPLVLVKNEKPSGNEQVLFKHAWETDMQLVSQYLDEKTRSAMKVKTYLLDRPEFKTMMSDYIHSILLMKPEDVIEYTINHFLSFAPQYLQQNEYFN